LIVAAARGLAQERFQAHIHAMREEDQRRCKCGALYSRTEHMADEREFSSFECAVCGATMKRGTLPGSQATA
jgi:predicted SprT family Zn-dependent metalloprotease